MNVPGYEVEPDFATALYFPLVLKDSLGGGGRGRSRFKGGTMKAEFLGVTDGGAYCVPLLLC